MDVSVFKVDKGEGFAESGGGFRMFWQVSKRAELVLMYPPILNAQKEQAHCSASRSCWTKFLRKAFITTIEWPAYIPHFNTVMQAQVILVIEKFDMVSW